MSTAEQGLLVIVGIIVGAVGAVSAALAADCWVREENLEDVKVYVPVASICFVLLGVILWTLSN